MPLRRQAEPVSTLWPGAGRHRWSSGDLSPLQTHAHGHLVYAATGVLAVHTEAGTSVVPANRVAWTPAGHPHQHRAHGDTDMRIVFLPPALARLVSTQPVVLLVAPVAREILLTLTSPDAPDRPGPARTRLLRVLVDELHDADEQPLRLPAPRDDRLRAVAELLTSSPENNDSLTEIGRRIGASSRTLSRLIRGELGMTFYEWRTHVRVYHALVHLAAGHDVTRTAHACGWANASSFIDAFAAIVGTTPGQYPEVRPAGAAPPRAPSR